jgi:hypothetical protein
MLRRGGRGGGVQGMALHIAGPSVIVSAAAAAAAAAGWHVCLSQDVSGGLPVQVQGPGGMDMSLYGMQIDLDQARAELRAAVAGGGTAGNAYGFGAVGMDRDKGEAVLCRASDPEGCG